MHLAWILQFRLIHNPSLILINRLMNIPCGLELLIEVKTLANPLTYLLNKSSRLAKKSDLVLLDYCYYCHDYISSCCSAHYPLLLLFTTATITTTRYYDYYYYNDYSSLFYFISLLLLLILLCWSSLSSLSPSLVHDRHCFHYHSHHHSHCPYPRLSITLLSSSIYWHVAVDWERSPAVTAVLTFQYRKINRITSALHRSKKELTYRCWENLFVPTTLFL